MNFKRAIDLGKLAIFFELRLKDFAFPRRALIIKLFAISLFVPIETRRSQERSECFVRKSDH